MAFGGGLAVDSALDVKYSVDALDRLQRHRRDDGWRLASGAGLEVGEDEELASRVRPTGRFDDRRLRSGRFIELASAAVCVSLANAAPPRQMLVRVLARSIAAACASLKLSYAGSGPGSTPLPACGSTRHERRADARRSAAFDTAPARRRGRPRAVDTPEIAAESHPLVDPARAGKISASGANRTSVHRRRAVVVAAVDPDART